MNHNFTLRLADASASNLTCDIVLLNAELLELESLPFNVTLREEASMQHIKDGEMPIGESEVLQGGGGSSCPECDGISDFLCITVNGCWSYIIGVVLGLSLIGFLIYCMICKCVPCRLLNCCIKKTCTIKKTPESKTTVAVPDSQI